MFMPVRTNQGNLSKVSTLEAENLASHLAVICVYVILAVL